jgi:hypothetical protein
MAFILRLLVITNQLEGKSIMSQDNQNRDKILGNIRDHIASLGMMRAKFENAVSRKIKDVKETEKSRKSP